MRCKSCYSADVHHHKYQTFDYWFCKNCNDEAEVTDVVETQVRTNQDFINFVESYFKNVTDVKLLRDSDHMMATIEFSTVVFRDKVNDFLKALYKVIPVYVSLQLGTVEAYSFRLKITI